MYLTLSVDLSKPEALDTLRHHLHPRALALLEAMTPDELRNLDHALDVYFDTDEDSACHVWHLDHLLTLCKDTIAVYSGAYRLLDDRQLLNLLPGHIDDPRLRAEVRARDLVKVLEDPEIRARSPIWRNVAPRLLQILDADPDALAELVDRNEIDDDEDDDAD